MSQKVQISIGNAEVTLGDTTLSVKGLELQTDSDATVTLGTILAGLKPAEKPKPELAAARPSRGGAK